MKKIFLLFLLFLGFFAFSQDKDQKQIITDTEKIITAIGEKNYDGILDLTYPEIFNAGDREMIKPLFKNIFEGSEEVSMEFIPVAAKAETSEIYTSGKNKYAFSSYPVRFRMAFKNTFSKEQQIMITDMMKSQQVETFFLDPNNAEISQKLIIIALNDDKTKGIWKYITYDENNTIFNALVAPEILEKAKSYKASLQ